MIPHCSRTRPPTVTGALSTPPAGQRPPVERPQLADPAKSPPGPGEKVAAQAGLSVPGSTCASPDPAKSPPGPGEMVAVQTGLSAPGSTHATPDPGPAVQARPSPVGADLGGMPVPSGEAISAWPGGNGWGDGSAQAEA